VHGILATSDNNKHLEEGDLSVDDSFCERLALLSETLSVQKKLPTKAVQKENKIIINK
jgi:hypothetical protein